MDLEVTFGPLAQFMCDDSVEEIWINSPERIFIARAGKSELTNLLLTTAEVHNIVERANTRSKGFYLFGIRIS